MVGVSRAKRSRSSLVGKPPATPEILQLRTLARRLAGVDVASTVVPVLRQMADRLETLAAGFYRDNPTASVDEFIRTIQGAKRLLEANT